MIPRRCCASSPTFVGEPAGDLEFLTSATATIAPTHSVGGNPVRMTSGAIKIEPDEEWQHDIAPRDRVVATAIALPLLHRYGLPVRSAHRGDRRAATARAHERIGGRRASRRAHR